MLTGETVTGAELRPFAAAVLEGTDPFAQLVEWYRKGPARMSAQALRTATHAVRVGTETLLGGRLEELEKLYLDEVLASHDGNEGIEAFIARRAPVWEDR